MNKFFIFILALLALFHAEKANATAIRFECKNELPAIYKHVNKIIIYHWHNNVTAKNSPITAQDIEKFFDMGTLGLKECVLKDQNAKIQVIHEPNDEMYNPENLVFFVQSQIYSHTREPVIPPPYKYGMILRIYKFRYGLSPQETFDLFRNTSLGTWYFNEDDIKKITKKIYMSLGHYFSQDLLEPKDFGEGLKVK